MPAGYVRPMGCDELRECPCINWKKCFILWACAANLQSTQFSRWGTGSISATTQSLPQPVTHTTIWSRHEQNQGFLKHHQEYIFFSPVLKIHLHVQQLTLSSLFNSWSTTLTNQVTYLYVLITLLILFYKKPTAGLICEKQLSCYSNNH